MTKKCIYCNNTNIKFVDNYKYEIPNDVSLLGKMEIFECSNCRFVFSYPMPDLIKLNHFYEKIYRSKNRHHYYSNFDKKYSYLFDINLEYISYLTSNIDFNKITTLLDFGCGLGNIGYALKKKYKHLELYCIESDEHCAEILKKREYKNFKNIEEINQKFDLVIGLHVFEHLTNLDIIKNLINLISKQGYIFFEVPNNNFYEGYKERVFDSPHLIFFNNQNIANIFEDNNLSKVSLINASYSIKHDIENQYYSFLTSNKGKGMNLFTKMKYIVKTIIKSIEPNFINSIRRKINIFAFFLSDNRLKWYFNNAVDSRCLRGIYKK